MPSPETPAALAFLGQWLADDVQTPTREETELARSVALALAEIERLLGVLRDRPVTWVCTCGRMNSGPACDFCPRVTTLPEQLLAITASAAEAPADLVPDEGGVVVRAADIMLQDAERGAHKDRSVLIDPATVRAMGVLLRDLADGDEFSVVNPYAIAAARAYLGEVPGE